MSWLELSLDAWTWAMIALVSLAGAQLTMARWRGRRVTRRTLLSGAAVGLLLVLALLDPHLPARPSPPHLVVVVDVSRSVLRSAPSWDVLRRELVESLRGLVASLPASARRGRASLVVFAQGSRRLVSEVGFGELVSALAELDITDLPPAGASHLGEALGEAAEIHLEVGGRGAVLLVTDGHRVGERQEAALDAAGRLAGWGLPIHILPRAAPAPELGLFAADLADRLSVDADSRLRAVLFNQTGDERRLELRARVDGGATSRHEVVLPASVPWTTAELPFRCTEGGIHAVELAVLDPTQDTEPRSRRQLLTHCVAPPRILLVGYDPSLATVLETGFEVESREPDTLDGIDPADYDVTVLRGVRADRLATEWLASLAVAIEQGAGLFLANGPHLGRPEAPTLLMSYDESPLAELLPLRTGQRPLHLPAPPLTIFILVDSSGSMGGWKLGKAKEIGFALIDRLRPIDTLYLMGFTTGVTKLAWGERMNDQGREAAKRRLASLGAGGGTDPRPALRELDAFRLRDCGLFVISDGGFEPARTRPGCEGTAFAVGVSSVPATLLQHAPNAEPVLVSDRSFDARAVRLSFFEPEPRQRRFEPGRFSPLVAPDAIDRGWQPVPGDPLPFDGNALTHRRDEATRVMLERPRPRDPILAYREHGTGRVGELTSPLPEPYRTPARAEVLRHWIEELLPFTAQRRFEVTVEPRGEGWALRVTLLDQQGKRPEIDLLTAKLGSGATAREVALHRDPRLPGVFEGRLEPPVAGDAVLVLREAAGPDAERRDQRIPWHVPAALPPAVGPTAEDADFGLDEDLLFRLAAAGRGQMPIERPLLTGSTVTRSPSSAPWYIVAALVFYLAQIAERHFHRPRRML